MFLSLDLKERLAIAYALGEATKLEELSLLDFFEVANLIGFSKFKTLSDRLGLTEQELACIKHDLDVDICDE